MPFLKEISFNWGSVPKSKRFPFNISSLRGVQSIPLKENVTFFIGENGSGKSTLLEAISTKCGFSNRGGSRNNLLLGSDEESTLETVIKLSWLPKVTNGFFFRAETFFNFAGYLDELGPEVYKYYGGKSLNKQSHGEAFLSLFAHRFNGRGLYILDEPESALSPQRQLVFLRIMRDLEQKGKAQFIIATHSPILIAYPNATIYSFDESPLREVHYWETEHYQTTKNFLNDPEKFLKRLFEG
ncbi:MAG: AAA family ATPase [Clostridia bacterium]|nr:AAA family ATPase [Clostridia bacterium]